MRQKIVSWILIRLAPLYRRGPHRIVHSLFHMELIAKTSNFRGIHWLGHPIWQNVIDLWTIQETITEVKPTLLIETGTHRGGSALFYAHLFDLMDRGRVITIDIEKLHDLVHPRVRFLMGGSTSPEVVARVRDEAQATEGPVMVILDSDHSASHVSAELELYSRLVTPGSFIISQDGVLDRLPLFGGGPGPLRANEAFLKRHPEFEWDRERNERFLITHHPVGWLRRKA
jgi:cephalosporin hydroxylase